MKSIFRLACAAFALAAPLAASAQSYVFDHNIGVYGIGAGAISTPVGVALDSGGNVYAASLTTNRIMVYDNGGGFLRIINGAGSVGAGLNLPFGVAVDASGNTYVTDSGNNRVEVCDSSGAFVRSIGGSQVLEPVATAFDAAGNMRVVDYFTRKIIEFGSMGAV